MRTTAVLLSVLGLLTAPRPRSARRPWIGSPTPRVRRCRSRPGRTQEGGVCFVLYVEVWGKGQGPNFRPDMAARNPTWSTGVPAIRHRMGVPARRPPVRMARRHVGAEVRSLALPHTRRRARSRPPPSCRPARPDRIASRGALVIQSMVVWPNEGRGAVSKPSTESKTAVVRMASAIARNEESSIAACAHARRAGPSSGAACRWSAVRPRALLRSGTGRRRSSGCAAGVGCHRSSGCAHSWNSDLDGKLVSREVAEGRAGSGERHLQSYVGCLSADGNSKPVPAFMTAIHI